MSQAPLTEPVTIDQMPDYQATMQKIVLLAQNQANFHQVVAELGLAPEFQKMNASMEALKPQAMKLQEAQQNVITRGLDMEKKAKGALEKTGLIGFLTAVGGSIIGYSIGKSRGMKGSLLGTGAGIVAGIGTGLVAMKILKPSEKEITALQNEFKTIEQQKAGFVMQSMEIQKPFLEGMTTRMLERRLDLVPSEKPGEMKLVSTAEPSKAVSPAVAPSDSLTRFATPPAGSKTAAVQESKTAAQSAVQTK